MRQDNALSYADMSALGLPDKFIEDYQGLKRELAPQFGTAANPNGVFVANLNGTYFNMSGSPAVMWVNRYPGTDDQWVQVA